MMVLSGIAGDIKKIPTTDVVLLVTTVFKLGIEYEVLRTWLKLGEKSGMRFIPDFFLKAIVNKVIQQSTVTMRKAMLLSATILYCLTALVSSQDIPIIISADSTYQTIKGFGGFGAKKVWWDNPPYYDQEYLNQVIDTLGCTFIRTQIYWDAEQVNDNADPNSINWTRFNFGTGTDNGKQFDFIRDLGAKGAKLLATVWTPPIWMKGLGEFHGTLWGNPVRRRPSNSDLNQYCSWWSCGCQQVRMVET
jgi:hypothetical protein